MYILYTIAASACVYVEHNCITHSIHTYILVQYLILNDILIKITIYYIYIIYFLK